MARRYAEAHGKCLYLIAYWRRAWVGCVCPSSRAAKLPRDPARHMRRGEQLRRWAYRKWRRNFWGAYSNRDWRKHHGGIANGGSHPRRVLPAARLIQFDNSRH